MDRPERGAGGELVLVRIGGSRYALPMACVDEVGRPPAVTRVPGLPTWVVGVANWRGRVLPVVDLHSLLGGGGGSLPGGSGGLLGGGGSSLDRRARLVVLSHAGVRVGLLVETVAGAAVPDSDAVEPALAHLPDSAKSLLIGQVTDAEGPYGVVDVDAVVALSQTLPRARRAG